MAFTPMTHSEMPHINDKMQHFLAFGYLTLALRFAYPSWATPQRTWWLLFAYGVCIEVVQTFIPRRQSSGWDLMADSTGILVALVGMHLVRRWWPWATSPAAIEKKSAAPR
jgi:VanZ family protein